MSRAYQSPEDELRAAWWALRARLIDQFGPQQALTAEAEEILSRATAEVPLFDEIPKCYWCAKPHYPHADDCPQMMGDLKIRAQAHLWE